MTSEGIREGRKDLDKVDASRFSASFASLPLSAPYLCNAFLLTYSVPDEPSGHEPSATACLEIYKTCFQPDAAPQHAGAPPGSPAMTPQLSCRCMRSIITTHDRCTVPAAIRTCSDSIAGVGCVEIGF
jgi:hypothetical protein